MEEFNKLSDEEVYKKKKKALATLILVTIVFAPNILMFFLMVLICIAAGSLQKAIVCLFLLVVTILFFEFCIKGCSIYLIEGRDINLERNKPVPEEPKFNIIKPQKKEIEARVEGIIGEREREMLDKDKDGFILVNEYYPLTEPEVLDLIIKEDPNFSKVGFHTFVKSVFVLIQEAWSENDYRKLRAFEGDKLYYRHKAEIMDLIKNKEFDSRKRIYIKGVLLKDFRIESGKEIIIVAITARMRRNYNGVVTEEDYPYIMAFTRNKGVKTKVNAKLSTTNCCNCGAVIDVSDDGVCNYCNTSLVSGELEWVLVDMKLIDVNMMD